MVIAPAVGLLLLFRHERARFSAYVFLSCEIVRGFKIHSPALIVLAAAAIVYFQTPRARAVFPRIDPAAVRRRLRSYVGAQDALNRPRPHARGITCGFGLRLMSDRTRRKKERSAPPTPGGRPRGWCGRAAGGSPSASP